MSDACFVPEAKVSHYLLNPNHIDGGPKSAFFGSFGFRRSNFTLLSEALVLHFTSNGIAATIDSPYGQKFVVIGPMPAPDGRSPIVKSIWIQDAHSGIPWLVTAMPG